MNTAVRLLTLLVLCGSASAFEAVRGGLTVQYSDARDKQQLGTVFTAWEGAARDLQLLGLPPPTKVRIEAASSAADFAARTQQGTGTAALTRGSTIYTQRLSALARSGRLPITIRHEAFHIAQPANLPRWLAEGMARIFSREAAQDTNALSQLKTISANELSAALLSNDAARRHNAYLEATRRAAHLIRDKGWRGALNSGVQTP